MAATFTVLGCLETSLKSAFVRGEFGSADSLLRLGADCVSAAGGVAIVAEGAPEFEQPAAITSRATRSS
jgi:hypothetical protein